MSFLKDFHLIIANQELKDKINAILSLGEKDPLFIDYFGVNYDDEKITSVKFYFSFLSIQPPEELLNDFNVAPNIKDIILKNWSTSNQLDFMHKGFTFGLKCYLKNGRIEINKYIHFRINNFLYGLPETISLSKEDQQNFPGICVENFHEKSDFKKYFYLTTNEAKNQIFNVFNLNNTGITTDNVQLVEYTESNSEKKINLIIPEAKNVERYLKGQSNTRILELCKHFYDQHQLYYYGPGIRLNSTIKAIYFIPKEIYYQLAPFHTLKALLNKL